MSVEAIGGEELSASLEVLPPGIVRTIDRAQRGVDARRWPGCRSQCGLTRGWLHADQQPRRVRGIDRRVVSNRGIARIKMVLRDETEFDAEVVKRDPGLDIALLHVRRSPKDLAAAAFGDSDASCVGKLLFAIGHPWSRVGRPPQAS